MKVFVAHLSTETNAFSPFPTGLKDFGDEPVAGGVATETENRAYHGRGKAAEPDRLNGFFKALLSAIEGNGWDCVFSLLAGAQPAGLTVRKAYEDFRAEIISDLRHAKPIDMVFLFMHGAMMAQGYEDCEGDLLTHIRSEVGDGVTIGLLLDPHCHMSDTMIEKADLIACYKEYPHTDALDRGLELLHLMGDTARGTIKPVISSYDCRMLSVYYTEKEPMKSFVADMKVAEEEQGILHTSLVHGFPWADLPFMGTRMLVTTDNDRDKGDAMARLFGEKLFGLREQTAEPITSLNRAVEIANSDREGPIVMSDWTDVAGGGAPSDSTYMLSAFLENGVQNAAIAFIYDPGAVSICHTAGIGALLNLRVGGKICRFSGPALDLDVEVIGLKKDYWETLGIGSKAPFGDVAAVRCKGIDILLCSIREQPRTPETFTCMGLDPAEKHVIVLKGMHHWRDYYADTASEMLDVAAHGLLNPEFMDIPYQRMSRPRWPIDDDPFGPPAEKGSVN